MQGRSARSGLLAALAASVGGFFAGPGPAARAQDCAPPDLEHAVPADGAAGVPTDAVFRARYHAAAEHRGEVVVLQRAGEPEMTVDAEWQPAERTLLARPAGPLAPGETHILRWPALRSVAGEVLGAGAVVTFAVGEGPDTGPPTFDGVEELGWDARRTHDDCVGSDEERYVFDFRVAGASDDTGPGTLEALVFQSVGPELAADDPPPVISVAPMPAPGERLRVRLPREQALGEVCFVVVARDLAGNLSAGGEEACTVTERPPFFGGCSVTTGPAGPDRWVILGLALAPWLTLRRRGPRSARSARPAWARRSPGSGPAGP